MNGPSPRRPPRPRRSAPRNARRSPACRRRSLEVVHSWYGGAFAPGVAQVPRLAESTDRVRLDDLEELGQALRLHGELHVEIVAVDAGCGARREVRKPSIVLVFSANECRVGVVEGRRQRRQCVGTSTRSTVSPTPQKRGPCAALSGSRAARPRCSKLTAARRRRRARLRRPSPSSTQRCPTSCWAAALMQWPAALRVRCGALDAPSCSRGVPAALLENLCELSRR